jgi:hypothetical protein
MKSFNSFFTVAEERHVIIENSRIAEDLVTTFGRHQPPHLGHGRVLDHAKNLSGNIGENEEADLLHHTSRSQDPKQNPIPFLMKLMFLKKLFPDHAENWDADENVTSLVGMAKKAHQKGYKNLHVVSGSDKQQGIEDFLRRYNGNLFDFENIYSHKAGERDMDDDPISQLKGEDQRKFALNDDLDGFMGGYKLSDKFTMNDAKQLFDLIRTMSQVSEEWEICPDGNKDLIREMYREGQLFQVGDMVESMTFGLTGRVHRCGANHLICVTEDGIMFKNFVHDVQINN